MALNYCLMQCQKVPNLPAGSSLLTGKMSVFYFKYIFVALGKNIPNYRLNLLVYQRKVSKIEMLPYIYIFIHVLIFLLTYFLEK